MIRTRRTAAVLILLSCIYFLGFVPPNLTGAKDPSMLAAFGNDLPNGSDERERFEVVIRMTTRGGTFRDTLQNTLFYGYYQDGYPFFFSSAVTLFPVRLAFKLIPSSFATSASLLALRQLSVLCMLAAVILLVYLWTAFESPIESALLFVILGLFPAVFLHNMSWNPYSLVTLFVVLAIFSLTRDNLRFGRWYYIAAVSLGLAAGTKPIGIFLIFPVGAYLVLGRLQRGLAISAFLKHSSAFALVAVMTFIVSNPTVLSRGIGKQYVGKVAETAARASWEQDSEREKGHSAWYTQPWSDGLPPSRDALGSPWFYLLLLLVCLLSLGYDREKTILNVIILAWMAGIAVYGHYFQSPRSSPEFLPVFLPVVSGIGNLFGLRGSTLTGPGRTLVLRCAAGCAVLVALQVGWFVKTDINAYFRVLHRENRSASIRFYQQLYDRYLSQLPRSQRISSTLR